MTDPSQKVFFVSLGCPKNRVDSEVMLGKMAQAGHRLSDTPEEADVIVVNTCGFIDAAREESIDTILEMAEHKKSGRVSKLIVTGCLSQRYPDELAQELPEIDHIIGSADFRDIAGVVSAPAQKRLLPVVRVSATPKYLYDHSEARLLTGQTHSAYVKIAEGCDRPCSFCIIPKLRGAQRSRSIDSVVKEIENLVAKGTVEINLIAQDLTRYGVDRPEKPTLAALLDRVTQISGLRWVRLHYTYPTAFSDQLIEVIGKEDKVCKYIDVPLQHIDFELLKKMRRGHSPKVIYDLIGRLRSRIDDLVLRTTFIVGHPGETDEAFSRLKDFIAETAFDRVGTFVYSSEPGTHSATLGQVVPREVAEERQAELMELQREISRAKHEAMVGRDIEVLVDGASSESEYLLEGRWYGQAPEVDGRVYLTSGNAPIGSFVRAQVTTAGDYDLAASLE